MALSDRRKGIKRYGDPALQGQTRTIRQVSTTIDHGILGQRKRFGRQSRTSEEFSVYGNKGSTDQHAYVQQLREGVLNFFATFIEVLKNRTVSQFLWMKMVWIQVIIYMGFFWAPAMLSTKKTVNR